MLRASVFLDQKLKLIYVVLEILPFKGFFGEIGVYHRYLLRI